MPKKTTIQTTIQPKGREKSTGSTELVYVPRQRTVLPLAGSNQSHKNDFANADLLRRGQGGIGFRLPSTKGRNMTAKDQWRADKAYPSTCLNVFSWNAGNIDRRSNLDTIVDLIASGWHIALLQEASSEGPLENICIQRAILRSQDPTRDLAIHAGGTGLKMVELVYDQEDPHSYIINKPWAISTDPSNTFALGYYVADVAAFDPDTLTFLDSGN